MFTTTDPSHDTPHETTDDTPESSDHTERPRRTAHRRRRLTPTSAAVAFVAAQVPLAAVAIALDWPETDNTGSVAADVILFGSPISGPVGAQAIVLTLAALASRTRNALGTVGRGCMVVIGALIAIQGVLGATAEPRWAPRPVAVVGGLGFVAAGLTLAAIALSALTPRIRRAVVARATP